MEMAQRRERRQNGRPPIDPSGNGTRVYAHITGATYDELYEIAQREGIGIATLIRQAIEQRIISERRSANRPH